MITKAIRAIRAILGKIILLIDRMFSPTPIHRPIEAQKKLDQKTEGFALYQFEACPFCIKVRREIKRLNLKIKILTVTHESEHEKELISKGGMRQVPCLYIPPNQNQKEQWMYESSDINAYLNQITSEVLAQ